MIKKILKQFLISELGTRLYNHMNIRNHFHVDKHNTCILKGLLNTVEISIKGKDNRIEIECGSILSRCTIKVYGNNNNIHIDSNCKIHGGSFWVEDDYGSILIAENTTISGRTEFACIEGKRIIVGKDCMFSRNIRIVTGDSHSIINNLGERINPSKNITIGDHVWVGNRTTISKGTVIPSESIVASNSLVNKDFTNAGSCCMIAGIPATIVKYGVKRVWDSKEELELDKKFEYHRTLL